MRGILYRGVPVVLARKVLNGFAPALLGFNWFILNVLHGLRVDVPVALARKIQTGFGPALSGLNWSIFNV